jgi:hypothetical protein
MDEDLLVKGRQHLLGSGLSKQLPADITVKTIFVVVNNIK